MCDDLNILHVAGRVALQQAATVVSAREFILLLYLTGHDWLWRADANWQHLPIRIGRVYSGRHGCGGNVLQSYPDGADTMDATIRCARTDAVARRGCGPSQCASDTKVLTTTARFSWQQSIQFTATKIGRRRRRLPTQHTSSTVRRATR